MFSLERYCVEMEMFGSPICYNDPLFFTRKRAKAEQCLNHPWLCPETEVTKPLTESEEEQSESEPSTPDAEELVLMASYTLCRQLDKDVEIERTAVHKQFQFKEPFTTLRDFLSA